MSLFNSQIHINGLNFEQRFLILPSKTLTNVVRTVHTVSVFRCADICLGLSGTSGCLAASYNSATEMCLISNVTWEDNGEIVSNDWNVVLPLLGKCFSLVLTFDILVIICKPILCSILKWLKWWILFSLLPLWQQHIQYGHARPRLCFVMYIFVETYGQHDQFTFE